jgi:hypothetical protein
MRSYLLAVVVVLAAHAAARTQETGQDKPRPTLAQDRDKLAGLWKTADWRKAGATAWQCHIAVSTQGVKSPYCSLTINLERGNTATSGPVLGSLVQLKDEGDRRVFALDPDSAKRNGLPAEIDYRFDGDALILKFADGPAKGEYTLHRVKDAK